jgi:hypothetical protein
LWHLSYPTDYFQDVTTFVEPGFCRRVCEGVLEEHVRRASSAAVAALDRGAAAAVAAMGSGASSAAAAAAAGGRGGVDADDMVLGRLVQDERDVQVGASGGFVNVLCFFAQL